MIKFRCELCEKKIGVPDEYAGKHVKCPGCGEVVTVPEPEVDEPVQEDIEPEAEGDSELAALQRMMDEPPEATPEGGPPEGGSSEEDVEDEPYEEQPEAEAESEPAFEMEQVDEASAEVPIADPPVPPRGRGRGASPSGRRDGVGHPGYRFIQIAGHVVNGIGVLILIIALLFFIDAIVQFSRDRNIYARMSLFTGAGLVAGAFYNFVLAQMLYAFRHIAINSWYLRKLGE